MGRSRQDHLQATSTAGVRDLAEAPRQAARGAPPSRTLGADGQTTWSFARCTDESRNRRSVLVAGRRWRRRACSIWRRKGVKSPHSRTGSEVQRVIDTAEEAGLGERMRATHHGAGRLDAGIATLGGDLHAGGVRRAGRGRACAGDPGACRARQPMVAFTSSRRSRAGKRTPVSLEELQRRYRGWEVTVEPGNANTLHGAKSDWP